MASTIQSKVNLPTGHPDTEAWYSEFASQLWSDLQPTLQELATDHNIPLTIYTKALKEGWSSGSAALALAEPLPPEKWEIVADLFKLMGFIQEDLLRTDGMTAALLSMVLWSVVVGDQPTLFASMVQPHPFNLRGGEIPLMFFGSVVYSKEVVSRSSRGGYGGLSVRLARGMYFHFGGFEGQRIDASTVAEIDYGGMLLTTENMYFGGGHTNFRIPYERVVSFRAYSDGIGVFRDTANAKAEIFRVLERRVDGGEPVSARPMFGWFLFNMAHYLAQTEARTQ